jgi:single-strand DNA-binding protein
MKENLMQGINKVILVGTLGQDPKLNVSREGKNYVTLSLATNRKWKNADGKLEERTDWHRVNVWGKTGAICQEYLKKGQPVCVEGYISTTETNEGGERKWFTFITANEINFLPTRKESAH